VNPQQNRIVHVLTPHFHPLADAADWNALQTGDAVERANGASFSNRMLPICSVEQCGGRRPDDQENACDPHVFKDLPDHPPFSGERFSFWHTTPWVSIDPSRVVLDLRDGSTPELLQRNAFLQPLS
jgi:hypothetical protein